jgi:long-chain acyl-CoA synthetase
VADSNLATLHRRIAERLGRRTALRFKRNGLYQDLSWAEYRGQADRAAAGLIGLGIAPGDRVGLLAENSADWLVADLAVLSAGAVDVPMHAPMVPNQVAYQLRHSGARGVIVSDRAQAAKVLSVLDDLPALEWIASFAPSAPDADGGRVRHLTWDGLKHAGYRAGAEGRAEIGRREAALTPGDLATIIYTSGTTGQPKGVMLSHGNFLSNIEAAHQAVEFQPDEIILNWLPYSHIYARTVDHYLVILGEATLCLAASIETLLVNLAETQPTRISAVPRFYEKVWTAVEHLEPAARARELRSIFGPRIRQLGSGGAPLPRHICEGVNAAGLPMLEGYGLTESSPVISFNRLGRQRCGTVGQAIPGIEVAIAADGEILTRGPHVMQGYWNDPEATRAAVDAEGWLHTGDVGHLDADGYLAITDRKKDLIITSGGKNIAPSELERLLASDPCIDQAVVYGDRKPFVAALIVPNLANLDAEARRCDDAEALAVPKVEDDLIRCAVRRRVMQGRVDRLMQAVSQPERVRAFLLLARPFQLEAGEVTPTLKLRRRQIHDRYRDRLEALYTSNPEVPCG